MTEFNERIEGEIKTHEAEMLRKAVIAKYGDKSLVDRVLYIMERYPKGRWSADDMFAKLTETGLNGPDSVNDVKNIFSKPATIFPSEVTA